MKKRIGLLVSLLACVTGSAAMGSLTLSDLALYTDWDNNTVEQVSGNNWNVGCTYRPPFIGTASVNGGYGGYTNNINMAKIPKVKTAVDNDFVALSLWYFVDDGYNPSGDQGLFGIFDAPSSTPVVFRVVSRQSIDKAWANVYDEGGADTSLSPGKAGEVSGYWTFFAFYYDGASGVAQAWSGSQETGNLVTTGQMTGLGQLADLTGVEEVVMGNRPGNNPFSGWIDETAMYDAPISQADAEALFQGGLAGLTVPEIIPEPTTVMLLLAGGLAGLIRRRK